MNQKEYPGNRNCYCKGRGWFTTDMMGSSFIPCENCNTHEMCPDGIHVRRKTNPTKR